MIDVGELTDKDILPVKSLKYGGALTQISSVKYILSPLVCSGKARVWTEKLKDIFLSENALSHPN